MQTASISSKGQVVIPKQLRDQLGLRPGSVVTFAAEGDGLRLSLAKPARRVSTVVEGYGLAGYKGPRISEADIRNAAIKATRPRG